MPGRSARLQHINKLKKQEVLNYSTLSKMEKAGKAGILCSVLLLFFSGNQIFAMDIYTNTWAVKVPGGVQDAKRLALKHGLSYERHVSSNSVDFNLSSQTHGSIEKVRDLLGISQIACVCLLQLYMPPHKFP